MQQERRAGANSCETGAVPPEKAARSAQPGATDVRDFVTITVLTVLELVVYSASAPVRARRPSAGVSRWASGHPVGHHLHADVRG